MWDAGRLTEAAPMDGSSDSAHTRSVTHRGTANMLIWSIAVAGAIVLGADAAPHQKNASDSLPAPAACTQAATPSGRILQTSHLADMCNIPAGCECPAVPSCAMPAAPACCQPVVTCAQPFMPSCAEPIYTCAQPFAPSCAQPVECGCAQPMMSGYCGDGAGHCGQADCQGDCNQSCCDRCCNKLAWKRAHTTGDMYPHYAYYPQDHGYYYFRPYNYMNVYNHMGQVVALGGDPRNPYSVAMFDPIYEDFYQQYPRIVEPPAGSIKPFGSSLPNLEDLLRQRD